MILPLVVAAAALTFEGIALGDDAAKASQGHNAHVTLTALGTAFGWQRAGGGTMLVAADKAGMVAVIDFTAAPNEADSIDLPGAPAFPVSHDQNAFEAAAGVSHGEDCPVEEAGGTCAGYSLADGTELILQFAGLYQTQLHRATWGRRDVLLQLHVLPPPGAPP